MAYLFDIHPKIFLGHSRLKIITPNDIKSEIISRIGIENVYFEAEMERILAMQPENFVREIIVGRFGAEYVAVGFNYHFGASGKGDCFFLKEMGIKYGFLVEITDEILCRGEAVSSTAVREALACGNIKKANELMVSPYTIRGEVAGGKKLGRQLGFSTANVSVAPWQLLPKNGVYKTRVICGGESHRAITNVGTNPTVENIPPRTETHILGFDREIYGMKIDIAFEDRIRDEKKFNSPEELANQIKKDIAKIYIDT